MATLVLPATSDAPFYSFDVELEGRSFTCEFRWNERAGAWFFSLYDSDHTPLVSGRRVVIGTRLFGYALTPALPPGLLMAIDTGSGDVDPGRYELGGRVVIVYDESTGS